MLSTECKNLLDDIKKLEAERTENRKTIDFLKRQFEIFKENQREAAACQFCKFYQQHYGLIDGDFYPLHCGHCHRGRIRGKKPVEKCRYFEVREKKE